MNQNSKNIILLHSALATSQDMEELKNLLEENGFTTFSFSFSGHGVGTKFPKDFRIDSFAHELDQFIRKNNISSPAVFGHSMGGYVALYFQAHFENSPLTSIFTYGTKFNWSEQKVQKELIMLDPHHLQDQFPAFAQSLQEKHGDQWKQLLLSTAHMMQNLERLDGLTKEDFEDVKIPVTLMLGDQDRMVSSEETSSTQSHLPFSSIKMISHSKHEISRANVKEIAAIITNSIKLVS